MDDTARMLGDLMGTYEANEAVGSEDDNNRFAMATIIANKAKARGGEIAGLKGPTPTPDDDPGAAAAHEGSWLDRVIGSVWVADVLLVMVALPTVYMLWHFFKRGKRACKEEQSDAQHAWCKETAHLRTHGYAAAAAVASGYYLTSFYGTEVEHFWEGWLAFALMGAGNLWAWRTVHALHTMGRMPEVGEDDDEDDEDGGEEA